MIAAENRFQQPARPLREPPRAERRYWILVPLGGTHSAASTVRSVLLHAAHPERLWLIGTDSEIAATAPPSDGRPFRSTRLEGRVSVLEALDRARREEPGDDLLLLAPGMEAAPLFDARLAWSAASQEGVVAVSPLSDVDTLTGLRRFGLSGVDPLEVDDRVSRASLRAAIDAPYVVPECVYLRIDRLPADELFARHEHFVGMVQHLRRRGLLVALAPHIYLDAAEVIRRDKPLVETAEVDMFLTDSELHQVAASFFTEPPVSPRAQVRSRSRPRILHVTHSLGGGLERWVRVFCGGAGRADSLILKSIGERGRFGSQLWLYDSPEAKRPLRIWKLARPIAATVVAHLGYRRALDQIVRELGIDAVIVSSLIGHSLDVFRTGLPTVSLAHDYYPFCPALHIHFHGVCSTCDTGHLAACLKENALMDLFDDRDTIGWSTLRQEFIRLIGERRVDLVAPSASVVRHYRSLVPDFAAVPIPVVPHGGGAEDLRPLPVRPSAGRRLRVVVPGRLSRLKGGELLHEVANRCQDFADFHLLGCGEGWKRHGDSNVYPRPFYRRRELQSILEDLQPDLALLLSVVPETFSFTLGECMAAAVPPIATRVGSFEDRIEDGRNGFLRAPDAGEIAGLLRTLDGDRERILDLQRRLQGWAEQSAAEMVEQYTQLLDLPAHSPSAYFSRLALHDDPPGVQLPPGSPIGFQDFLRQVEEGTYHHLAETKRLRQWQRRIGTRVARAAFGTLQRVIRAF